MTERCEKEMEKSYENDRKRGDGKGKKISYENDRGREDNRELNE